MNHPIAIYPFAAVQGQADFKLALLLTAINPLVGGVLISGPRGCAKSTLSKGLAELLTDQQNNNHPFVTLPLGASEDMLTGTLDLQQVLDEQQVTFKPGLLAKAHGGVLYIDEINLLPDNLVDQLLDAAASGINVVERDGVSHQHEARFLLLGTMNPDEGELRPQLTDRFGLSVQLSNQFSVDERIKIVELREQFDRDPAGFRQSYHSDQQALTLTISAARRRLEQIQTPIKVRQLIAERSLAVKVDGLRADIVWLQASRAHAALAEHNEVSEQDVLAVEEFVLGHRRHQESPPSKPDKQPTGAPPFKRPEDKQNRQQDSDWGALPPQSQKTETLGSQAFSRGEINNSKTASGVFTHVENRIKGNAQGSRQGKQGSEKLNWFSTLAANAGQWPIQRLLFKPMREGRQVMHIVLLDTSGSVLSNNRFGQAKGLVLQIAEQAYLKREQICLIGFGNESVETLFPMRRAPKQLRQFLDDIKASGGTPFAKGLEQVWQLQQQQLKRNTDIAFTTYIVTDGRIKDSVSSKSLQGEIIVADIEQAPVKRGRAREIAQILKANYISLMA